MRSILFLILLGGCGDPSGSNVETDDTDVADTDVADTDVDAGPVSFALDIQPIFDQRCASCHNYGGNIPPNLETPQREALLDVTRYCEDGEIPLVVPGDPDASFFVYKIGGVSDHAPTGRVCKKRMPQRNDGKSLADLDPDAVAKIRAWIAEGAEID